MTELSAFRQFAQFALGRHHLTSVYIKLEGNGSIDEQLGGKLKFFDN